MTIRTTLVVVGLLASLAGTPVGAEDRTFSVRDYGAKGDRETLDTAAIQAAVDACAKVGGGVVLVSQGDYLSATIRLKDRVTLRIAKGACLWVSADRADYDGSRQLLVADGAVGVSVEGEGAIDGQATGDFGDRWGQPNRPEFRTGILLFQGCKDVAVRGITIRHSDAWTLHFRRCENVAVQGVTIRNNYRRLNSDGIVPNMCRNVRITGCDIVAGDDCIVLKTTEAEPCEDVVVTDCRLESAATAIKLGTESHGDFRNVRFSNCKIRNSFIGIGLYLKDGGTMENVRFENIDVETCAAIGHTAAPVFMDIERRNKDSKVGTIRNVIFENIRIRSGSGILVQGMPESPITGLALKDVRFRVDQADDYAKRQKPVGGRRTLRDQRDTEFARLPAYATIAHARNLLLEGLTVEIAPEAFARYDRSALCGREIQGGLLRRVRREPGQEAGKRPVVDLETCRDVRTEPDP